VFAHRSVAFIEGGWSSYRHYADGGRGIVLVNEERKAELRVRKIA
jgi:hypothetical protein